VLLLRCLLEQLLLLHKEHYRQPAILGLQPSKLGQHLHPKMLV
jgi:hypothetical protein